MVSLVLLAVLPGLASAGLNAPGTTPAAMNQLPLYGPPDPAQWVNVATLLPASGTSLQHDPFTDSFTYGFGTQYLVLVPGFSVIRFESRTVTLSQPVIYYDSALFIAKADTPLFRQFVVVKPLPPAKPEVVRTRPIPRDQVVVIDAGHGGHDTGAIANGIYEKNVNLRMARYLKPALEARGFRVKLTRSSDTFIELEERTEIANRCSADFFVAVHANSERSGDITGVETFYYSDRSGRALVSTKGAATSSAKGSSAGKSALSVRSLSYGTPGGSSQCRQLASCILQGVLGRVQADDRGVKSKALRVLRYAECPAALVEIGFLTNRQEARRLIDGSYLKRMAEGIADGLVKFSARNRD